MITDLSKLAKVVTQLQPHQQRVVDRMLRDDQPGLVVAHGLGSGKTLTSIAAHDALNMPADMIVPAALQGNYEKEIHKHHKGNIPEHKIHSLQNLAVKGEPPTSPMMIVDEAHRLRDPGSKGMQAIRQGKAKKRMLLTATPFYNHPVDIAPLVNVAAGDKVIPEDKGEFTKRYIEDRLVKPGFFKSIMGVKPGIQQGLNPRRKKELQERLNRWVDYHPNSTAHFPSFTKEVVRVPMSKKQQDVYDFAMGQAPLWVRWKVKSGLPPSKAEAQQLNAFLGAARQISNTTRTYQPGKEVHEPKIDAAVGELKKEIDGNPRAKAVIYSNYLDAGINPYKEKLIQEGIPFGEFTGAMDKKDRDELVKKYNEDKLKALLISSAGAEGLDLKGTRLLQVLDPHWNEEKIHQIEGRGIRFKSHEHLPENERHVRIQRFLATRAPQGPLEKLHLKKPGMGVDEYMLRSAEEKERLNNEFRQLLTPPQQQIP